MKKIERLVITMVEIICEGPKLLLRRAEESDLEYILGLEYDHENIRYIYPFDREEQLEVIHGADTMDVIVVEKETGEEAGYFMVKDIKSRDMALELTHVIIGKKGRGYGHEALKLMKRWAFEELKFHRVWLDCKEYNDRALHLYEAEGFKREGIIRECLLTHGVFENLVVLGILDREYFSRKSEGQEF